jgi:predicted transcriptional regulator
LTSQKVAIITGGSSGIGRATALAKDVDDSEESQLPSYIFMDLASDTRYEILKMLDNEQARATKIASTLKLTKQETHRNTARLTESGMIKKGSDGLFLLTEFGKAMISQFPYFQFLNKHKEFFENHTLENVPEKFIHRLGELEDTIQVSSVAQVLVRLKKMESLTKNELKLMSTQGFSDEAKTIQNLIKKGVKMQILIGKNTIIPREILEELDLELLKRENVLMRRIEKIEIALFITDEGCAIMFPNRKGEINMNSMLVGNDNKVREWCDDVFEHYWKTSKPFTNFDDLIK